MVINRKRERKKMGDRQLIIYAKDNEILLAVCVSKKVEK